MQNEVLTIKDRLEIGLELGESHFREFKSAITIDNNGNPIHRHTRDICKDIGEALVAFSNADGGELFIGIEDDGTISGVPHTKDKIKILEKAYINNVHARTPIDAVSKVFEYQEKTILYFRTAPCVNCVVMTSDGRCIKRFDRQNLPVPAESIQIDRKDQLSKEYDRRFIDGATMIDLDNNLIDSISKQISQGYSPEKFLQYFDLSEFDAGKLRIRQAALLLFSKDISRWHPRCEVRILRVSGTELKSGPEYNVVQDERVEGNIIRILESSWDQLRPHLARTKFQQNALFRESIIYPESACRETLINAIAHRDYSLDGKPIEILIYDDHMEVRSPGGLPHPITVEDLKELKGEHISRNVLIAKVLRELGYMREMGEGMRRIFSSVRGYDLVDPDLRSSPHRFTVTLYQRSVFSPKAIEWLGEYEWFDLSKNEQRVVLMGIDGHLLSTDEIMKNLGIVDTEEFRALHESLSLKGVLVNRKPEVSNKGGRRKIGRFQVVPPNESQQYLDELLSVFSRFSNQIKLSTMDMSNVRKDLSPNSPYQNSLRKSLAKLNLIDGQSKVLPKGKNLKKELPPRIEDLTQWVEGKIANKHPNGFGFIKDESGNEYFFHISNFLSWVDWNTIDIGTHVKFRTGESRIPGKPFPAKEINILNNK